MHREVKKTEKLFYLLFNLDYSDLLFFVRAVVKNSDIQTISGFMYSSKYVRQSLRSQSSVM